MYNKHVTPKWKVYIFVLEIFLFSAKLYKINQNNITIYLRKLPSNNLNHVCHVNVYFVGITFFQEETHRCLLFKSNLSSSVRLQSTTLWNWICFCCLFCDFRCDTYKTSYNIWLTKTWNARIISTRLINWLPWIYIFYLMDILVAFLFLSISPC